MGWTNPDNLALIIQGIAALVFFASLTVFVFWVALPIHRLVSRIPWPPQT